LTRIKANIPLSSRAVTTPHAWWAAATYEDQPLGGPRSPRNRVALLFCASEDTARSPYPQAPGLGSLVLTTIPTERSDDGHQSVDGIIGWIVLGLAVGAIAEALNRGGHEPGGVFGTLARGVMGAVLGGLVASAFGIGSIGSFFSLAIIGAYLALAIYSGLVEAPHRGSYRSRATIICAGGQYPRTGVARQYGSCGPGAPAPCGAGETFG
jgi:uncharacterized membrane protein YeaQ/YmgE (transglycosylase-associated protein family)